MRTRSQNKSPNLSPDLVAAVCDRLLADHSLAVADGTRLWDECGVAHLRRVARAASSGWSGSHLWSDGRPALPMWDGCELWLGGDLVKAFDYDATAQMAILTAFEGHKAWRRSWVDDPLPREDGETEEEARERLHNAVKNLNRGLKRGTIRFRRTGMRVRWEYAPSPPHRRAKVVRRAATPIRHPIYPQPTH